MHGILFFPLASGGGGGLGRATLRMLALAMAAALLLSAVPRQARSAEGCRGDAECYAARPKLRHDVIEACNRFPQAAKENPECAGAWQGNIIAAEREARRMAGLNIPPSSPGYWRAAPEERREYLAWCDRMPAEDQAKIFCGPAREAQEEEDRREGAPQPPKLDKALPQRPVRRSSPRSA